MQNEFLRLQSALKKTIVFITHDFDEAIRLADRIAIMRDGEIIQIGTPEELIISPADRLRGGVHARRAARQGPVGARLMRPPTPGARLRRHECRREAKVDELRAEIDASPAGRSPSPTARAKSSAW